jgi:hypothetical protein
MNDFNFSFEEREETKKPLVVVYGPSGVGKTSLAASAKDPVFIQTEDGAGELKLKTLKKGIFSSFEEVMGALRYLYTNPDNFETVVVDTIDHFEPLVWDYVCRKNKWDSIEQPGYGRGYIECDLAWREFISALIKIRDNKNKSIILLAHEIVRTVNDPMAEPYDAHELKLHKRAVAYIKEKSDMIGLLKNRAIADSKGKGKGGTTPTLFVRPSAAFTAKTRYTEMPSYIDIDLENGWSAVAKYISALKEPEQKD